MLAHYAYLEALLFIYFLSTKLFILYNSRLMHFSITNIPSNVIRFIYFQMYLYFVLHLITSLEILEIKKMHQPQIIMNKKFCT